MKRLSLAGVEAVAQHLNRINALGPNDEPTSGLALVIIEELVSTLYKYDVLESCHTDFGEISRTSVDSMSIGELRLWLGMLFDGDDDKTRLLTKAMKDGSLFIALNRLVELGRRDLEDDVASVQKFIIQGGYTIPMHDSSWHEGHAKLPLNHRAWDNLKRHGRVGDWDHRFLVARVFRIYVMWRINMPQTPALVVARQSNNRVRYWRNPRFFPDLNDNSILSLFVHSTDVICSERDIIVEP